MPITNHIDISDKLPNKGESVTLEVDFGNGTEFVKIRSTESSMYGVRRYHVDTSTHEEKTIDLQDFLDKEAVLNLWWSYWTRLAGRL